MSGGDRGPGIVPPNSQAGLAQANPPMPQRNPTPATEPKFDLWNMKKLKKSKHSMPLNKWAKEHFAKLTQLGFKNFADWLS